MKRRYTLETLDDWNDWEEASWLDHPLHGSGQPRRRPKKKK